MASCVFKPPRLRNGTSRVVFVRLQFSRRCGRVPSLRRNLVQYRDWLKGVIKWDPSFLRGIKLDAKWCKCTVNLSDWPLWYSNVWGFFHGTHPLWGGESNLMEMYATFLKGFLYKNDAWLGWVQNKQIGKDWFIPRMNRWKMKVSSTILLRCVSSHAPPDNSSETSSWKWSLSKGRRLNWTSPSHFSETKMWVFGRVNGLPQKYHNLCRPTLFQPWGPSPCRGCSCNVFHAWAVSIYPPDV